MAKPLRVLHLMASPFFGGPERQMLTLAQHLPKRMESSFATFWEGGKAADFYHEVQARGFRCVRLESNFPHLLRAVKEVAALLGDMRIDLITSSGYKPDIIGWAAARRTGIPLVVVSHGWTGVTRRVRLYEYLDKRVHAAADAVVCVSMAQRRKVLNCGVAAQTVTTIANAVDEAAFSEPGGSTREKLRSFFASPPDYVIATASRLSCEKGTDVLIEAASAVAKLEPAVGFIIFGDGPLFSQLHTRILQEGLSHRIVLAGFHRNAARYFSSVDIFVLSSRTEGLPIALLEAGAAGAPIIASNVGGISEIIVDGVSGLLLPSDRPDLMANAIVRLLNDGQLRASLGMAARERVRRDFFAGSQSKRYEALFDQLCKSSS